MEDRCSKTERFGTRDGIVTKQCTKKAGHAGEQHSYGTRPPRNKRDLERKGIKQWACIAFRNRTDLPPIMLDEYDSRHEALEACQHAKEIFATTSVWLARRKF